SSITITVSFKILASRYPLALYLFRMDSLSSAKPSSVYFERFQTLIGFFCFTFFMVLRNLEELKCSFPEKVMLLTFTLLPRLMSIFRSREVSTPKESIIGVVVMWVFVFKYPSLRYFFLI